MKLVTKPIKCPSCKKGYLKFMQWKYLDRVAYLECSNCFAMYEEKRKVI